MSTNDLVASIRDLSVPRKLALGGTAAAFLFGWFSWWTVEVMGHTWTAVSGFDFWSGKLFFLAAAGMLVYGAAPGVRASVVGDRGERFEALVALALTSAVLLFGPLMFLMQSESVTGPGGAAGRTLWFWCALLGAGTAVAGAVLALQEARRER